MVGYSALVGDLPPHRIVQAQRPYGLHVAEREHAAARGQVALGLSTSVALPGSYRFAFGLIGSDNHFVYGPSAVYIAPSRSATAQGPYPAPIQSMLVQPRFASTTVAQDRLGLGLGEARLMKACIDLGIGAHELMRRRDLVPGYMKL